MKRKLQVLLMAMLLPLVNTNAQDSVSCVHDQFLQEYQDSNLRKGDISNIISYGTKRFREKNPDLQLYPKPQPAPPCEMCMTIDPSCFKSKYALPVIVHIVAKTTDVTIGQNSNIPDDQVYNALAALNKQFAGYGQPNPAVNTGIQFYLAPVGPDNNGIIRYNDALSSVAPLVFAPLRNLVDSPLNTNQYIHIFVVDTITQEGIMGYASYPETGFNHAVVVTRKRFGDASKPCSECQLHSQSRNKTLAHELGHFLGLRHTFKDGCAPDGADCEIQGDGCCDTEPVDKPNFYCPVDPPVNSCPNTPPDQIRNFMDYTSESCAKWFTRNQTERMYFSLETFKQELIDLEHLFTYLPDICMFSARFKAYNNVVCDTGGVVTLKGIPYTTTGVKYIWTIYDSTQTVVFDTIAFDHANWSIYLVNPGRYDVRLQVIFGTDTATEMVRKLLWVVDCDGAIAHEGGNWFFGKWAGLVFGESGVRASTDALDYFLPTINTIEGGISISDPEGNLMFYGGGVNGHFTRGVLYNSNHVSIHGNPQFNGFNIADNCAQAAIVFPHPADTTISMMLHSTSTYDGNLYYSLMYKKPNGFYDTVHLHKNLPVTLPDVMKNGDNAIDVKENLTVMRKCYGTGFWIATTIRFSGNDNDYYVAIISIEDTGFQLIDTFYIEEYNDGIFGQGRFSPDGTKYATFNHVFDFDRATGKLSFKYKLPFPDIAAYSIYGLTFSPNSRYLYWLGEDENSNNIYTYRIDLSLNNPLSAIQQIGEAPNNDFYHGMQIGPDGRIYIANDGHDELYVINRPDADWDGSDNPTGYIPFGVSLKVGEGAGAVGGTSKKGLPNHIDAKKAELVHDTIYFTVKNCRTVEFSTTACCRSTYRWEFGDGNSQNNVKKAKHTYSHAGVYEVLLILDSGSISHDTIRVNVPLFNPKVRLIGDTLLCNQNQQEDYTALDLDSFTKHHHLQWEIKDGTYNNHHSSGNTIVPNFASLPAQVIVHVVDPGSECTASDTLTVNQIAELVVNQINNGVDELLLCNQVGSFGLAGSLPVGSNFYYSWYYSHNNEDWHEMQVYTQNLPNQPLGKAIYLKRLVYPDACENWSNVVKVIPVIQNNQINIRNPFCEYDGDYSSTVDGETLILNDMLGETFYYKWQTSTNGYTWSDVEPYKTNDNYGAYDWWYNSKTIVISAKDNPVVFVRRLIFYNSCLSHSNTIKLVNFNLKANRKIDLAPNNNDILIGKEMINPDSLFVITWQKSCDHSQWTEIDEGFNQDTLWNLTEHYPYSIRRKIVKLDYKRQIVCDSLYSYYDYPEPNLILSSKIIDIGEYAVFGIATTLYSYDLQWQKFNSQSLEWEDLEGENGLEYSVKGDLCNDQAQFRVKVYNGCKTFFSNSATLRVNNPNPNFFHWLKDIPGDVADEPNNLLGPNRYLLSPDIRVTYDPLLPSHLSNWPFVYGVNLFYNGIYVHVKIRNNGSEVSKGGKLFLHASLAGSAPHWDFSFINQMQTHIVGNAIYWNMIGDPNSSMSFVPVGTAINQEGLDIPDIAPGDSVVLSYHWHNPPAHFVDNRTRLAGGGVHVGQGKRSILYLARIENCAESPHALTHPELFFPNEIKHSLYMNVKNNARIAGIHSHYLPMKGPKYSIVVEPDLWADIFDDKVMPSKIVLDTDSSNHFFSTGEIYVYFDQNLWDAFVLGGYTGSGYTIVSTGVFRIDNSGPVFWDNISLAADSVGQMGFSFHYKPGSVNHVTLTEQIFAVDFYQGPDKVGELFLHTQSQTNIEPAAFVENDILSTPVPPSPSPIHQLTFLANPNPFSSQLHIYIKANENAVVDMYDMSGRIVATTEAFESGEKVFTLNTSHLAEGVYFLKYISYSQQVIRKLILVKE